MSLMNHYMKHQTTQMQLVAKVQRDGIGLYGHIRQQEDIAQTLNYSLMIITYWLTLLIHKNTLKLLTFWNLKILSMVLVVKHIIYKLQQILSFQLTWIHFKLQVFQFIYHNLIWILRMIINNWIGLNRLFLYCMNILQ